MNELPDDQERLRARVMPRECSVMRQVWRHLAFLHWEVDPQAIASILPRGLAVDTFEGRAYLGIVPFTIPLSRAAALGVPLASPFHEVNLRTYVHRAGRDPGVWFFSLDAASRLAVAGARLLYGLPYFHAGMAMQVSPGPQGVTVDYESRRRRAGRARDAPMGNSGTSGEFRVRYRPMGSAFLAQPGTVEFFLAERYLLYASHGRALSTARVHHSPYQLQVATADQLSESLTTAAGIPHTTGSPALIHYSHEVDVRIYRPHRIQPT